MANAAIIAATAAQAATRHAEQQTIDAFRIAGATAPERALPLRRLTGADAAATDRLRSRGLVREERGSALWLDEQAVILERDGQRSQGPRAVLVALAVVLAGLAVLLGALLVARAP